MTEDWRALNHANWEARVALHTAPDGYDLAALDDPGYLTNVVRYDLPRLGRLDGLDVVHLQCHLGTDTISLSRLGARSTVGLDFSGMAVREAARLAHRVGADVEFVEGDVYDAVDVLGAQRFDLVYTGIGALCWLPDVHGWAEVVSGLLRASGRLFMREGHPVLWSLDDPRPDGLLVIQHPYFQNAGVRFVEEATYGGAGTVTAPDIVCFNHGLGEIFTSLQEAGLTVTTLVEHREVPWNPLGDALVPSTAFPGEFVLADHPDRLPLTYTLDAVKRAGRGLGR